MNEAKIKTKRHSTIYKNTIYIREFIVVDPIHNSSLLSKQLSDTDFCFYVRSLLLLPILSPITYHVMFEHINLYVDAFVILSHNMHTFITRTKNKNKIKS